MEVGYSEQDVVAGVAGGGVEIFDLAVNSPVERGVVGRVDGKVAVDEVGLDLSVGEER